MHLYGLDTDLAANLGKNLWLPKFTKLKLGKPDSGPRAAVRPQGWVRLILNGNSAIIRLYLEGIVMQTFYASDFGKCL